MRVVVFGHSHVDALIHASRALDSIAQTQSKVEFKIIRLPITTAAAVPSPDRQIWYPNPGVISVMDDEGAFLEPDSVYVSVMGGNEHNIFGLFEHPQPFNIFGTDYRSGRYIPIGLMKALLETATKYRSEFLPYVQSRITGPLYVLETPPPTFDNAYLLANINTEHHLSSDEVTIAPPSLRRLLWKIVNDLTREHALSIGADFIETPREALEDGFLAPHFRANDVTHGNADFGETCLRLLYSLLSEK